MRRMTRPLVAAALCLAGLPLIGAHGESPAADDLRGCRAKGQAVVRDDHWIRINAPKMDDGEGPRTIVDYATPMSVTSRVFVTNGRVLKVSADAGCTWDKIFEGGTQKLDSQQASQDNMTAVSSVLPSSVWVASYDDVSGATHPHVYVAHVTDDVAHVAFQEVGLGMAPAGKPVALATTTTDEDLAYVLVETVPDAASGDVQSPARELYASHVISTPAPATAPVTMGWQRVTVPAGFGQVLGMSPSGTGPGLWIWSAHKYAVTQDPFANNVTWDVKTAEGEVAGIDASGGIVTVAFRTAQGGTVSRDVDDLTGLALPLRPTSVVHATFPGVVAVAGERGVQGYDIGEERWVDLTPKAVPPFSKLSMGSSASGGRILVGQTADALYRFDLYPGERFLKPPELNGFGDWRHLLPDKSLKDARLTPVKQVVSAVPGQRKDVPVVFEMPPSATPLDVYFLVDTTASMGAAIVGLRDSIGDIADNLRAVLGHDACFGLGEFRDYTEQDEPRHTYLRRQPITCEDPSLPKMHAALQTLMAGGGGDYPEPTTLALQQSATGDGAVTPPVDAKQGAGFRAGSYKVIVVMSDAPFKKDGAFRLPSVEETAKTLNTQDIKVVGVLANTGVPFIDQAHADLISIAQATSTFAPKGGVDCDGDGVMTSFDVPAGAPLVCEAYGTDTNIGSAIIGLLLGVADPGTLSVQVIDEHHIVQQPIRGATSRVFDLKQRNALAFALPVLCRPEQAGHEYPIGLVPSVRGVPIGLFGEVLLKCVAEPEKPKPPAPPPPPRPLPDPVVEPAHPAKPPVAVAVPPPPPAPAQPISNMNLNAGFSQQEEEQFQLAAVGQDASEEDQDDTATELAMSDYRWRDAQAGMVALGGATLLGAGAYGYRRRLQRSTRPRSVRC